MTGRAAVSRGERGSGSGLALAVVAVLALVATVVAVVGLGAVQLSRVRAAADLAALSGARAVADGAEPCPASAATARANGAELVSCEMSGDAVAFVVTVEVELDLGLEAPAAPEVVTAEAHAGSIELGGG